MAEHKFPAAPFNAKSYPRMIAATKAAIETADDDSGWLPTASLPSKVYTHNLNVVPSEVYVYTSDDPNGVGFQPDTYTNCNRSSITVAGTLAYTRVRINKGRVLQGR